MFLSTLSSTQKRLLIGGVVGVLLLVSLVVLLRRRATSDLVPTEGALTESPQLNQLPPDTPAPFATSTSFADASATGTVVTTAAAIPDTDGDGLTNKEEQQLGTDVLLRDTDGDGLSDYDESREGTDPLAVSILTSSEIAAPEQPILIPPPQAVATSTIEVGPPLDQDGDGLTDQEEMLYGTDPTKANTDGDGFSDAEEIKNGYNPLGQGRCTRSDCRR